MTLRGKLSFVVLLLGRFSPIENSSKQSFRGFITAFRGFWVCLFLVILRVQRNLTSYERSWRRILFSSCLLFQMCLLNGSQVSSDGVTSCQSAKRTAAVLFFRVSVVQLLDRNSFESVGNLWKAATGTLRSLVRWIDATESCLQSHWRLQCV